MYTLYYSPGAANLAVHQALIEIAAPYQLIKVDTASGEQKRPEYLAINPSGVVPTLMIDGHPVYECAALLLLLAERHPQSRLAPATGTREREWYLQWILHLANTLQPAFRAWFYPNEPAGAANEAAAKESARIRIEQVWDRLDVHLAVNGPYVAGHELSMADIHATMLMRWSRNMPKPALRWPHVRALAEHVLARPSWTRLYAEEGLTEWP